MELELVVSRREDAAEGIVVIELAAPDGGVLPAFEAGAHIEVAAAPGIVRQYSLCNDPAERHVYRLAVLRESASRGGSEAVHRDFQPGRTVQVSAPRNHFGLATDADRSILIAGGIGVTPILSMAHALHAEGRAFDLHYSTRSRGRAAFLTELADAPFAGQVRIYHDDGEAFDIVAALPPVAAGTHLYFCGPGGFMDAVEAVARAAGWPAGQLHMERFSADVDVEGDAFTVVAAHSGVTVRVAEGQTINEALAAAGVDLPVSCEQGICGTCLTDVIDGIPDHRDQYLTDEEKASNREMTPCCSRSFTPVLTLAI